MKTATFWRPAVLGAVLSAMGGVAMHDGRLQMLWATPAARADDTLNTLPSVAAGGTTTSASAHASASVTSSGSGQGCVAESTATATAQAGDQQKTSSDHKRVVEASGPCRASASSRADANAPADPTNE